MIEHKTNLIELQDRTAGFPPWKYSHTITYPLRSQYSELANPLNFDELITVRRFDSTNRYWIAAPQNKKSWSNEVNKPLQKSKTSKKKRVILIWLSVCGIVGMKQRRRLEEREGRRNGIQLFIHSESSVAMQDFSLLDVNSFRYFHTFSKILITFRPQ